MNGRMIARGLADTLAYGLFGKAEQKLDRPPVFNESVYDMAINFAEEKKADELAAKSLYFYSNMRVLSQKCGAAELYVKVREGERTEPVEDHPFERLVRRPNFLFAFPDLIEHTVWWLGLDGNAYWYLTTAADGSLAEIWPLPAREVKAVPDREKIIRHYVWRPQSRRLPPIPVEKICHFRMINPYSVVNGMSFLQALDYTLKGSDARFRWELEFFSEQRAVPEGLLSVDPKTTAGDVDKIREQLSETYSGGKRRIAVGRAGAMQFERFQLTQEEMAFLGRIQYDEKLFDRVFGFPGGYWDAKANRANAEQAEKSLAQDTIMPLLGKIAGNIEVQIIDRYYQEEGTDLVCEFEDVTPQDRNLKVAEFKTYSQAMTFDEARAAAGYRPVEGELGTMPFALIPALVQMVAQGFQPMPQVEAKAEAAARAAAGFDGVKALDDLRNWQQVALREIAKGNSPCHRTFYSDHVPSQIMSQIETGLSEAGSADEVRAVFAPWTMKGAVERWLGYP